MKVIIEPGISGDVIVTIAIGDNYYAFWETYAYPTWEKYCRSHGLGLIVFDEDLVSQSSTIWKKATWQKLLIGEVLKHELPQIRNVCYLDTDILINHTAPNVFDFYKPGTIGLVSIRKNLPYPYEQVLRRLAFFRNRFYDKSYPLDSCLFISLKDLYRYHDLEPQDDEACMGFILFNVANHSEIMSSWFANYSRTINSITGGGDQTHVNFEIQKWGNVSWLDYRFQALWTYEMAWKYPFLYEFGRYNEQLIRECVEASLFTNYFLHFAGSWYESEMWKVEGILKSFEKQEEFKDFEKYEKLPLSGEPKGVFKPSS